MITQIIRILLGIAIIMIGIVGLIVPIMPGWLFIIPGLVLINPEKGKIIGNKLKSKVRSISTYFN